MKVSVVTDYSIEVDMWLDNDGKQDGKIKRGDANVAHYVEVLNGKTKPLTVEIRAELPQGTRRLQFKGGPSPSEWREILMRIPGGQPEHAYRGIEVIGNNGPERIECKSLKYESQWKRGVWHVCARNLPLSMTVEVS